MGVYQHPITETHIDAVPTVTKKDVRTEEDVMVGKGRTQIHASPEQEVIKTHVHSTAVDKHMHEHPVLEKHLEVHPVLEEHIHEHPVTEKHIHQHPITEKHEDVGVTRREKTHMDADAVPKLDGRTHNHTEAKLKTTISHKHSAVAEEHIHTHPVLEEHIHQHPVQVKNIDRAPIVKTEVIDEKPVRVKVEGKAPASPKVASARSKKFLSKEGRKQRYREGSDTAVAV